MGKLRIENTALETTHIDARKSIAFESQFLANTVELAKTFLPSIFTNFKSEINSVNLEEKSTIKLSNHYTVMLGVIAKTNYSDISNLKLPVCEGFESNLVAAYEKVEQIMVLMKKFENHIKNFHDYVAVFITNKDAKKKTVDLSIKSKELESDIDKLKQILNTLFKEGNSDNSLEYSKLFMNNQEFRKAITQYVILDKKLKEDFNISEIKLTIENTVENLDSIIKSLKENKIENISSETTKSLSEGSYQVAMVAEAYSVAYFKLLAIMNIVPGFENFINESLVTKK